MYKDQMKTALGNCKIRPEFLDNLAAGRNTWRQLCHDSINMLEHEKEAKLLLPLPLHVCPV